MRIALLLVIVVLVGCAHRKVEKLPVPSVVGVKGDISDAKAVIQAARGNVEEIGDHLTQARNKASRIDGKARVLLENW